MSEMLGQRKVQVFGGRMNWFTRLFDGNGNSQFQFGNRGSTQVIQSNNSVSGDMCGGDIKRGSSVQASNGITIANCNGTIVIRGKGIKSVNVNGKIVFKERKT